MQQIWCRANSRQAGSQGVIGFPGITSADANIRLQLFFCFLDQSLYTSHIVRIERPFPRDSHFQTAFAEFRRRAVTLHGT
jgi:hypothetical protein